MKTKLCRCCETELTSENKIPDQRLCRRCNRIIKMASNKMYRDRKSQRRKMYRYIHDYGLSNSEEKHKARPTGIPPYDPGNPNWW